MGKGRVSGRKDRGMGSALQMMPRDVAALKPLQRGTSPPWTMSCGQLRRIMLLQFAVGDVAATDPQGSLMASPGSDSFICFPMVVMEGCQTHTPRHDQFSYIWSCLWRLHQHLWPPLTRSWLLAKKDNRGVMLQQSKHKVNKER